MFVCVCVHAFDFLCEIFGPGENTVTEERMKGRMRERKTKEEKEKEKQTKIMRASGEPEWQYFTKLPYHLKHFEVLCVLVFHDLAKFVKMSQYLLVVVLCCVLH